MRHTAPKTLLSSTLLATAVLLLGTADAAPQRDYRNEALHIRRYSPPAGWELSPQSPYPRILAAYTHPSGARITLSAERVRAGLSAQQLATDARPGLTRQGFTAIELQPEGNRVRLDAQLDGGKRIARQMYIVEGGVACVITLVAPASEKLRALGDFETALRSLELSETPAK